MEKKILALLSGLFIVLILLTVLFMPVKSLSNYIFLSVLFVPLSIVFLTVLNNSKN